MAASKAQDVPAEVLQDVFRHLSPADYDAARHTCQDWLWSSQDLSLLSVMSRRSGWSSAEDASANHAREDLINSFHDRLEQESNLPLALHPAINIDIGELSNGDGGPGFCGLGFTASVCGRFVLIYEGCTVYVYHLCRDGMQPLTAIPCPRRVLAACMEATGTNCTIAMLLEDRMGAVCELDNLCNGDPFEIQPYHTNMDVLTSPTTLCSCSAETSAFSVIDGLQSHRQISLSPSTPTSLLNTPSCPKVLRHHVANRRVEARSADQACSAPLSVYHSLCSPDDPPRSIAVCPTRRCIAFGCGSGIELHWIDNFSGRNYMKWYSLLAPSDCLYFLPSRQGIDNPNKLRLLSSKAGMGQRSGLNKFARKNALRDRRHNTYSLSSLPSWFGNLAPNSARDPYEFDHHHAIPLEDGFHVLFTDPKDNSVCIGSEAPVSGPTKLLRKIRFVPPPEVSISVGLTPQPPSIYAASRNIDEAGIRVAAIYNDKLVLFSVPPDVLADMHNGVIGHLLTAERENEDHWSHWLETLEKPASYPFYPLRIKGHVIGKVGTVVELAVQADSTGAGAVVVWTFEAEGYVRRWSAE